MKLFEESRDLQNLLPVDGEAYYFGNILDNSEQNFYLDRFIQTIDWRPDELIMFGKKIITTRKMAWYGEEPFEYTYSNTTKRALIFTEELSRLKNTVEELCATHFNSVLLNLYHSGNEAMGWHSDNESMLKPQGSIASVSLGAERRFQFRHKQSKQLLSILLEPGSLLEMKGVTQKYWQHRLPPSTKIHSLRINLTFRTILNA